MSNVVAFSLSALQPEPQADVQQKLLNNALSRFCDYVEEDDWQIDENQNLAIRQVRWNYGCYRFRAKLVIFDNDASIGQFDCWIDGGWQRLTTPRALAEKLTQARDAFESLSC